MTLGAITESPASEVEPPEASVPETRATEVLFKITVVALACAALVVLFTIASRHVFGGNSDDATLVLEGQSMASGNLVLHGWDLSIDPFWTLDAPIYAIVVALLGVGPDLMNIGPALIAALVCAASVWTVRDGRRGLGAAVGIGVALALLALPNVDFAYFFLQGGWHAATALCCLLAFVSISRTERRWGVPVAAVLLAAGLLGDLLTLTLAVMPVLLAGALAARRQRRWRAGLRYALAVGGALVLVVAARLAASAIGTYSIGPRSIFATWNQARSNVEAIPNRVLGFFGADDIVGAPGTPIIFRLARILLLVVVCGSVATAGFRTIQGLRRGSRSSEPAPSTWRIDDLLLLGILGDLASFVLFATSSSVSLARYLVPGFVFSSVLAGRVVLRQLDRLGARGLRSWALTATVVIGLCALDFGFNTLGPAAPQEARQLSAFLNRTGLHAGIGDYWSSSIVTVDSGGAVAVRPVDLGQDGTLVRYTKQSAASWYAGQKFQFFVYDSAHVWQDVTATAAIKTYGVPSTRYLVGTYVILKWNHPIEVAS